MENLICAGLNAFNPNATGAYVFCLDWIFWLGSSSFMRACRAAAKLRLS